MPPRVTLALALILFCATARADTLTLANGDTLNGEVVEWDVDSVVIDHPQLGRIRLSLSQLDIDTGEKPPGGLLGTGFLRGWKRSIDVGLNGKRGNSENFNLTAGLDFTYEDPFKRWDLNGRYFLNSDEEGVSDNNAQVSLVRDWLRPGSRWFLRAQTRYQFDEFEDWLHRITVQAAPGYNLYKSEEQLLDTTLGLAFTREFGERNRSLGEAVFGLDYKWTPTKKLTLTLSNQLFVSFVPEAGEIRNFTIGEWSWALVEDPSLSLKLGAQNEYETDVDPGDKASDLKYWLALGLGF